jgi:hypothetical protein
MKFLKCSTAMAVVFATCSSMASAGLFPYQFFHTYHSVSPSGEKAFLENHHFVNSPVTLLSVFENPVGFDATGAVDSSHFTVDLTSTSANVTWDLAGTDFSLAYLLFKFDYRANREFPHGGRYVVFASNQPFDMNGSLSADLQGFQHISFFGVEGPFNLPDTGASVSLLGISLFCLNIARRVVLR